MNYAQIFNEIKLLTKRGDIDDKIDAAIRMVTLRAHRLDYFWRDRVEAQLSWSSDQTIVDINILTSLPNFRATSYLRYWDPTSLALGNLLSSIDPRDVLDDYNYEKLDRYYLAGDILKIKFERPSRGVQIGYFASPVVYPSAIYSSWICRELPDLIIQGALAQIFNQTGKQEEARAINQTVGFDVDATGRSATKGQTLVEQLRQLALPQEGA